MSWFWGRKPSVSEPMNVVEASPPDPYMQWVPIEDHEPEISHRRLLLWNGCYMRYGYYLAHGNSDTIRAFYDDYSIMIRGRKITHYMYVPEPPEAK